ncbi:AbrB/MazE/SpoVT family DNA-binding domain-containing protein [Fervidobacterium sp.]
MHEIIQSSATISSKGQVQIPAKIRKAIGAQTGDLVIFRMLDDRTILMKVLTRSTLEDWA